MPPLSAAAHHSFRAASGRQYAAGWLAAGLVLRCGTVQGPWGQAQGAVQATQDAQVGTCVRQLRQLRVCVSCGGFQVRCQTLMNCKLLCKETVLKTVQNVEHATHHCCPLLPLVPATHPGMHVLIQRTNCGWHCRPPVSPCPSINPFLSLSHLARASTHCMQVPVQHPGFCRGPGSRHTPALRLVGTLQAPAPAGGLQPTERATTVRLGAHKGGLLRGLEVGRRPKPLVCNLHNGR